MRFGRKTNQRLHAWSFSKVNEMITCKASLLRIEVIEASKVYTSQRCNRCGKISKENRRRRGFYLYACGWRTHANVNAAANLYERFAQVSSLKRSCGLAASPFSTYCRVLLLTPPRGSKPEAFRWLCTQRFDEYKLKSRRS